MDEAAIAAMTTVRLGRLLIVDDEIELLTALRDALSERGYEVAAFSNPRDATAALREGKFDVLLTDLMMPGMSGIELIGEALKVDPNLVSIIITGQGTVQTAVEAMQTGAFDYVLKPFKLTTIMPVLSRAIELRRLRTEVMQLRETVAIHDLCKAISHTLDFDTLLHKVADAAMQQCEADEVSIVLPTRDNKELYVAVVRGRHERAILGQRMPIGEGVAGWVAQHHEPLILHGPVNDERFRPRAPRADIVSSICMPMSVGGKFVGVLNLNATRRTRPFRLGDVKALTIIASIASPVLESGWLFKQMREAEKKYRSIVENTVEGIFQTSPDGHYLEANPALARMCGYDSPAELMASVTDIGRQFYVDPHRRADFMRLIEEQGSVVGFESQVYRKDGTVIWMSENAREVRDETGAVRYFEGTTEDITARKRADQALHDSNRRLEEALNELQQAQSKIIEQERLRALGEMASGIAHDFNNALGPILGFSELLLMNPQSLDDKAKVTNYLQMMNTGAKDAASVVGRLREFYRQRDEDELFLPVNLKQLIEQVVSLTQPRWRDQALAGGRTIHIETQFGEVPMIHGNEPELREALTNLIFNAVDAMPQGGTITVCTSVEGSHAIVEVGDTGTGMNDEVRRRCLEPFFSTKGDHGTGLGLPMVYGILQRHKGTVDVESELGKGTTFIMQLPMETPHAATKAGRTAAASSPRLRILVAEDELPLREIVAEYLTTDGHSVETASNGREALAKFHAGCFDLIVTDRAMPEMNGDQLAAAIKRFAPRKPIIMLTGFGDLMNSIGERPEGVDLIVAKPLTVATLRQAVVEVLQ